VTARGHGSRRLITETLWRRDRPNNNKGTWINLLSARSHDMALSPTPEQSARAILDIFKSRNCYAGDPLQISYIKPDSLKITVAQLITTRALCMQKITAG